MDIKLNENHDYYLDGIDLAIVTDEAEKLKQTLTIKLQFLLGEWFLNTNIGIPYTQYVFDSNFSDMETIYSIFRVAITETENVRNLNELNIILDRDTRIMSVDIVVNENIPINIEVK